MGFLYRYKNLFLLLLGVLVALLVLRIPFLNELLLKTSNLGYFGALIAGFLFVYGFTVSFGVLLLTVLAKDFSPLVLALISSLGAMLGDLVVFKIVRDSLKGELMSLYRKIDKNYFLVRILKKKHFRWVLPFLGLFLIASPFPDEIGVVLVGFSRMNKFSFALITFILNFFGIFLLVKVLV
jgi:uncharacterized membrane protein YdjX (TVP38/TMEM64 family)